MALQTHPAKWWIREKEAVRCLLCPRNCLLSDGKIGYCGVRVNSGGELRSYSYGYPVAVHVDPIEKKPLYHFLPGTKTFSIGTFGCNLGCVFCQNYSFPQPGMRTAGTTVFLNLPRSWNWRGSTGANPFLSPTTNPRFLRNTPWMSRRLPIRRG